MLAKTEKASAATSMDRWLAQFERALAEPDEVLLKTLFHADSHWRDILALTWHIRTIEGSDAILSELKAQVGRARPAGFRTASHRTAPRRVTRAGKQRLKRSSNLRPLTAAAAESCGSPPMPMMATR